MYDKKKKNIILHLYISKLNFYAENIMEYGVRSGENFFFSLRIYYVGTP